MYKNRPSEREEYFKNAPQWFYDESLMAQFAESSKGQSCFRTAREEIRAKVNQNPTDRMGRCLNSEMNGLGIVTAEGRNGGEGHWFWTFRPHNFDYMDGFLLDYTKVYSFYNSALDLVKECKLSNLSGAEATELFAHTWCLSHELGEVAAQISDQ
jgi:hypothetical protein